MAPQTPVKIILGTHTLGDKALDPGIAHFDTPSEVNALLDAFHARGYQDLDTARDYPPTMHGGSETRLGLAGASSRFTVHSKVHNGPGEHAAANITGSIAKSLADLQTASVQTMFLHVPDRTTPFAETAGAMNDAVQKGQVKAFGLSNYTAAEVREIVDICADKGYAKPSVYQGHYNAISRSGEKELFPVLRELGIAFFAYSAAAGGFFSGSSTTARWKSDNLIGGLYSSFYAKQPLQDSVSIVADAAAKHGINGHAAAIRWTAFHSVLDGKYGDAVLFGCSTVEQLHKTLDALEAGPLPEELAEAMSAVYATVEGSEPPYHL
ncbi:NADP-dependent oxidoreductase domain-containing protein [Massariosphaeria phaeospora]|uniref:NADP-dependent oxidoreductase domain-containing protein n=1 Tax=Massariosphaeria phaeospora TaxID=100035 RepID=A0A7C8I9T7_9PLEO|nr:NADP-dependent oxidoreductase domain-containing protein [Massariosphaeria phaeospora]